MKANSIVSALVAVILLPTVASAAADGSINFTGTISSQTCDISVNNGDKTSSVSLPNIVSSLLASEGQVAGATTFSIDLKNCATKDGNVRAFFQAGTNVDAVSGNLKNNGTAKFVQVQLLDTTGKPLKAGDESQRSATNSQVLKDGAATMIYGAQYFATGKAEAGAVATSVEYSIDYL